MKKRFSSRAKKQTVPFFSAILLASVIFSIFISTQQNERKRQPIFSSPLSGKTEGSAATIHSSKKAPKYVSDQILVKYKDDDFSIANTLGKEKSKEIRGSKSVKKLRSMETLNTELVEITDGSSIKDKIKELKKDSGVEFAEPNYIYHFHYTPDDTYYDTQWALENTGQTVEGVAGTSDADMDVAEMWDIETDHSEDIIVAVIDSGVALNHPDISSNLVNGYDAVTSGVEEPYDNQGHGSHVAGVIAALVDNSSGISGISKRNNVKIMPIRASVDGLFELSWLLDAIDYATLNGADIINMSLGGEGYSEILENALESFPGLIVASAGNGGDDGLSDDNDVTPIYPASFDLPNIISVAATDQNDDLASFSNYGATSVDVGAPGVNIYSLEGYEAFYEDFELVTPPDLGIQFSSSGVNDSWETITDANPNTWVFADTGGITSGSYASDANSYLTSSSVNTVSSSYSYVNFYYVCDIPSSGGDSLDLEVYNGSNWTTLASYTELSSGAPSFDVTDYASTEFRIRFNWRTDSTDNTGYLGCYMDDIKIVDSSSSQGSYQYMDGTSMACPYTAAVAAVVWGKNPTITPAQLKSIILNTGDPVSSLSGVTETGKRINAYEAYSADPNDYTDEPDPPVEDPVGDDSRVVFHPDTRCHWKKPDDLMWIRLEKMEKDGVSGMYVAWTQYGADKVDIKIDDGTGNYPWKVSRTSNDGHEFLANVYPWQNIMIKPINHCKEGEYSLPVSLSAYPYGWYGASTNLASAGTRSTPASSSNVLGISDVTTMSGTSEPAVMVPETGSNEILFIIISSLIISFALYYVTTGKSRHIALRGFEKKASKDT